MSMNIGNFNPNINPLIQQGANPTVALPQEGPNPMDASIFDMSAPEISAQEPTPATQFTAADTINFSTLNASIKGMLPDGLDAESVNVQQFSAAEISKDLGDIGTLTGVNYSSENGDITEFFANTASGPVRVAIETDNNETIVTQLFNAAGNEVSVSTINKDTGTETIEKFDDSHTLTQQIENKGNRQSVTTNYENGQPISTITQNGDVTTTKDAEGRITSRRTDKGSGGIETENYTYNSDGSTVVNKFTGQTEISQKHTSQTYTNPNGVTYEVEYTEDGNTRMKAFDSNGGTKGLFIESSDLAPGKLAKMAGFDSADEFMATVTDKNGKPSNKFNVNNSFALKGQVSAQQAAEFANSRHTVQQNRTEGNNAYTSRLEADATQNAPKQEAPAETTAPKFRPAVDQQRVTSQVRDLRTAIKGAGTDVNSLKQTLTDISPNELGTVLSSYEKAAGHSLLSDIDSEWGLSDKTKNQLVYMIADKAKQAATEAGMSNYEIENFINLDSLAHWDDDSEKGLNTKLKMLDGAINTAYSTAEISEIDAASIMASANDTAVQTANEIFTAAREKDDKFGIAADSVLGWFGCTTIDDMKKSLGIEGDLAEILVNSAKEGDMESFKITYKQIFGQEFNPKTVAAYEEATTKYQMKRGYDEFSHNLTTVLQNINKFQHPERTSPGMKSYAELNPNFENETMSGVKYLLRMDDAQFADTLSKYGGGLDGLKSMISDIQDNARSMSADLGDYQSLKSDIAGLRANMFGGKDIVKDVEDFNKRQMATQIGANIIVDVAIAAVTGPFLGGVAKVASLSAKGAKLTAQATRFISNAEKLAESSKIVKYGMKGTKFITKSAAEGVTETTVKNLAHNTDNSSWGEIFQSAETNAITAIIKKTPLGKTARIAGASVDIVDILSEHDNDIVRIALTSQMPRADLMSELKVDADTANYIISNIRAELRA